MKKILLTCFMLVFVLHAWAQDRTVSGTVLDAETGEGLPGVNVLLKGTGTGITTDLDGNYKISVPSDGGTLVFTFIGMAKQEVKIGARSVIDVRMDPDIAQLSEVVVTGYSATSQKKLVSSVSTVNGDKINEVPMPDINQIIQGRAPGVYSSAPSGQPGAAQTIRIRGNGSITAGRGPLYVIDGVIMASGDFSTTAATNDVMSNINPNDIESMSILKDAAATSLYGSRGANGVILINTKQGKVGKSKITVSAQYGVAQPQIGNFDMMSAQQNLEYERQILRNSGFSDAVIDANRGPELLDNTTDWVDAAFRTGETSNYEIQASGGNENTRFFISGSAFNQAGTLIESDFSRYSLRSNLDHKLNDKLDVQLNLNVSYTNQLNAVAGNRFASPLLGAFSTTPLQGARDPETGELFTGLEPGWLGFTGDNFLYSAPLNPVVNNNLRGITKFALNYNILDNLRLSQVLNADLVNIREGAFQDPTTNDGVANSGEITEDFNQNLLLTSQTKLSGDWTIADKHNIGGLAVFEYQKGERESFFAYGIGLASGKLKTLNSTATPQGVGGFYTEYSFLSYIGQLNYDYDNKYFFTASIRRDGSSRFGADNRYANFWSVGGSYRIIEEDFLDGLSFISDLKLRGSYGTSGNADIDNFGSLGLYGFGVAYNALPGSSPSQISNPELTWEESVSANIGLDYGMFNDRVMLLFDVYDKRSQNLLLNVPISRTSGFTSALRNVGEVQNRGFEIAINTINVEGEFTWTTNFNISRNENKVLALNDGEDILNGNQIIREGLPVRSWNLPRWAGVNPANGAPLWLTEDGGVTSNYALANRTIVGDAQPTFFGGIDNTFSYKGITLSAFFNFVAGNDVYNGSRPFIESDGQRYGWNHLTSVGSGYWEQPGDEVDLPQPILGGNRNSNSASTRYLENGSFLRLRNVTLSYNLPKRWMETIGLQGIRVYGQGQNLLTFTDYSGFDPEMDENGSEFFRYPVGKVVTGGIEINF
ncbi:SusC/RagA family TonB-linked outer membrane protein [Marivirga harenae]|uniref:SusC/RagA family TonB-linked outer membrane protein n=1 Tax=Marivirga harenae TaxID=2010992 RepID=UPI0026DF5ADB|nr:TonB-dependent receptor [Marivirga harenae]WKV12798.1 TonB-dependent receptor [Marivirga harenae]